jgi:hypothetical protein
VIVLAMVAEQPCGGETKVEEYCRLRHMSEEVEEILCT